MRKGVIYKLTFPDGEIYIGRTVNLNKRLEPYKNGRKNNQHLLESALLKYGFECCELEIIEDGVPENELNEKEIFYIEFHKTMLSKYPDNKGLNICAGGAGSVGNKLSDSAKAKISAYLRTRVRTKGNYKMSDERKIAVSNRHKGNKYNLGRKWSDAHKEKYKEYCKKVDFSIRLRGRKQKDEEKLKQIEAQKKLFLNTQTGVYYHGFEDAAKSVNMNTDVFKTRFYGKTKKWLNRLPFIYA